jgi:hypothetical protein
VSQTKGLDIETLVIKHVQVNQAMKQRRRTYRAHGRVNRACTLPVRAVARLTTRLTHTLPPQPTCLPPATWS